MRLLNRDKLEPLPDLVIQLLDLLDLSLRYLRFDFLAECFSGFF